MIRHATPAPITTSRRDESVLFVLILPRGLQVQIQLQEDSAPNIGIGIGIGGGRPQLILPPFGRSGVPPTHLVVRDQRRNT